MFSKTDIYNLALGALLLTKRISDNNTDTSQENQTLNVHWPMALEQTLTDLDLDCTAQRQPLALVATNPQAGWNYAYKYPANCILLRRLIDPCRFQSDGFYNRYEDGIRPDTRYTQVPRQTGTYLGNKVIFCNLDQAYVEYIAIDISLNLLSASAVLALAYKLAQLAAPLITGKGAAALRTEILNGYKLVKAEAQELDRQENATFQKDWEMSDFVRARLS